jgi:hypothetical protein
MQIGQTYLSLRKFTWVQLYASSAVHSECEVGFDSEKMMGLCNYNMTCHQLAQIPANATKVQLKE